MSKIRMTENTKCWPECADSRTHVISRYSNLKKQQKKSWAVSANSQHMPALRPSSLISNIVDYLNLTKDTYTNVYSIFDFKSTKLETIQISNNSEMPNKNQV